MSAYLPVPNTIYLEKFLEAKGSAILNAALQYSQVCAPFLTRNSDLIDLNLNFFVEFKCVVDESVVVATIEKPLPMSAGRRTTRDRTSPTGCNWQCRLDGL